MWKDDPRWRLASGSSGRVAARTQDERGSAAVLLSGPQLEGLESSRNELCFLDKRGHSKGLYRQARGLKVRLKGLVQDYEILIDR